MTKEKPILFSGEMVRAILDGRKTQTRRVIKPRPDEGWHPEVGIYNPTRVDRNGEEYPGAEVYGASDENEGQICPFGQPGHRLWVRESCWAYSGLEPFPSGFVIPPNPHMQHFYGYDDHPELQLMKDKAIVFRVPSIHMPRWASRITLEVTKVRVERVQEIDEADSMAEGIKKLTGQFEGCYVFADNPGAMSGTTAKECYQRLWDAINAKRGFGWDANPWVWVIEFRRLTL